MIVQSLINSSDIHYAVGERTGNRSQVIIEGLNEDMYNVVVYDRGDNHLPEKWPAESQTVHTIQDQHEGVLCM